MFTYSITEKLKRKLKKIVKKDRILAEIFYRKIKEVVKRNKQTIQAYKNLRYSLSGLKIIHLTSNYILLFKVDIEHNHIVFLDILHWNHAYAS